MREAISNKVAEVTQGSEEIKVLLAGLSNVYTHYITTYEEYQRQRYEAASTIFGPHTLRAYMQQYAFLTEKLLNVSIHRDLKPKRTFSKFHFCRMKMFPMGNPLQIFQMFNFHLCPEFYLIMPQLGILLVIAYYNHQILSTKVKLSPSGN